MNFAYGDRLSNGPSRLLSSTSECSVEEFGSTLKTKLDCFSASSHELSEMQGYEMLIMLGVVLEHFLLR